MAKTVSWVGQALLYALFAVIIGTFSTFPHYQQLPPDQALIKLSFSHEGKRVAACRQRTPEELAKLAPNMRSPMDCPRARSPVTVEIDLDGVHAYRHVAKPAGLSKDGASTVYHRIAVPSGQHHIAVRVNDDVHAEGYNYRREEAVTLQPGRVLVIDFNAESGGITLK